MWNILGIEPTKDIREIKRAYARLAKQYNPEEHPEEFKRIFDAYKSASALARSVNERRSDPIVTITAAATEAKEQQEPLQHEQHEQSEQTEFNFTSVDIFPDFEITPQLAQEKFLQNMALILSDKNKRDDISCWKWLLGKPTFLSVCDDKGFRKRLRSCLTRSFLHRMYRHTLQAGSAVAHGLCRRKRATNGRFTSPTAAKSPRKATRCQAIWAAQACFIAPLRSL